MYISIKKKKMTTYKKVELQLMMEEHGSVTITAVEHSTGCPQDIMVDNFDEAVNLIAELENEHYVYF